MLVQWFTAACVIGVTFGGILPPPQVRQETECEPGAVWVPEEGCGACFCLQEGVAACSRMGCHGGEDPMPSEPERAFLDTVLPPLLGPPEPVEYRNSTNCREGEEWMEECNKCGCMENGMAVCTKMFCGGGMMSKPNMDDMTKSKDLADGIMERCKAGDSWSDECSKCTCLSAGQLVCSYSCKELPGERRRRRRQASCTPGQEWQRDCNNCFCLQNGLEACTKKACLTPQPQPQSVPAGGAACNQQPCPADCGQSRDNRGCITCTCGPDPFFSSGNFGSSNRGFGYWL